MKTWQLKGDGAKELSMVECESPTPKPGEVLVDARAASLNFRDHLLAIGQYPIPGILDNVIPASDGAGVVKAIGDGVDRVKIGDRVTGTCAPNYIESPHQPGRHSQHFGFQLQGWLAEEIILPETAIVKVPDALSFESAASLPCAGTTAWNAVIEGGKVRPGSTVLILGTGSVSLFALQIAKAAGARVIATSSSDAKLERVKAMGADETLNYLQQTDWKSAVKDLTKGDGVDLVVDTVGDISQSIATVRFGGTIAVIGILSFFAGNSISTVNALDLITSGAILRPIQVGSRRILEQIVEVYAIQKMEPVADQIFSFDDAPSAFAQLASGGNFGKIVITQ